MIDRCTLPYLGFFCHKITDVWCPGPWTKQRPAAMMWTTDQLTRITMRIHISFRTFDPELNKQKRSYLWRQSGWKCKIYHGSARKVIGRKVEYLDDSQHRRPGERMLIGAETNFSPYSISWISSSWTLLSSWPDQKHKRSRRNPPPPSIPIMLLTSREKL